MNKTQEIEDYKFPEKVTLPISKEIYNRYGSVMAYFRKHRDVFVDYHRLHAVISGRLHHTEIEQQLKQDILWHLIIWRTKKNV